MQTPDPPQLRAIRIVLTAVHLSGVVAIFLSFTYSISPWQVLEEMLGDIAEIVESPIEYVLWTSLSLQFLIAVAVWLLQVRAWFTAALTRVEQRMVGVAKWSGLAAVLLLHFSFAVRAPSYLDGSSSDRVIGMAILSLGVVGALGFILLFRFNHRRRLHALVLSHIVLRLSYVIGVGVPLLVFGPSNDLDAGGWISLGVCLLYLLEAIVFLVFGKRHPSGSCSHAFLRYWLPRAEAEPRPDSPVCATCGYDLRGTVPAGGKICPECGMAIAAT